MKYVGLAVYYVALPTYFNLHQKMGTIYALVALRDGKQ